MSTTAWSKGSLWEKRIERATFLKQQSPWAAELLGFYLHVLDFQKKVYERSQEPNAPADNQGRELRPSLDLNAAMIFLPELLETVKRYAPANLRGEAARFGSLSQGQVHESLRAFLVTSPPGGELAAFFPRTVLQPLAERMAKDGNPEHHAVAGNKCPVCGGEPQAAILRQEGDGGKRWLLCSFCQTEWEFHRILCPNCGEQDNARLPRFLVDGNSAVRLEACDSCRAYLKSFDLTVNGLTVPLVDEIATAPLDIWAAGKEYRKMQPNLFGF